VPRFFANRFVELCGLATSVLTAILVLAVEQWLNFSFFTLTFWVIVPVGALITGCLAASGYYFGAIVANRKPGKGLLVTMVIVAGATFFLIYYMQYRTLEIDGNAVSSFVPFTTFLQVVLTKAEYGLVRSSQAHFEVGAFGYFIGFLQVVAFMLGGFGTYLALSAKPFCGTCEKYLKKLSHVKRTFENSDAFDTFSQRLHSLSPPSAEYLHILKEPHDVQKPKPGAVALEWSLLGCPTCRSQLVVETPKVLNAKNEWSDVAELARQFPVDAGMPLLSEFNAAKSARQHAARPPG
jgi:hypothetical protein